jgi:hypothetical protein
VAVVTVEPVSGRAELRRFVEFAYQQFRDESRWTPSPVAAERARLDPHRNPYFERGDGEYFLARRNGVVAGRITAHVAAPDDAQGWFGFFDVVDDPEVTSALLERTAGWLRERGCTSMTGPASFTTADDPGVLVDGDDVAGTTGRPWHPAWYAAHLSAAGLTPCGEYRTWRLPAVAGPVPATAPGRPGVVGRFADPRLVLGGIVAVPDLTPARGSTMTLARRGSRHKWDGCTIVRIDGSPVVLVPQLQAAAAAAGYQWVISPWTPDPTAPPETVHARFTRPL